MLLNTAAPETDGDGRLLSEILLDLFGSSFGGGLVCCKDEPDYPIVYLDHRLPGFLGFESEALLGLCGGYFIRMVHEEDRVRLVQAIRRALADGRDYVLEFRLTRRSGESVWVRGAGRRVLRGGAAYLVNICVNISGFLAGGAQVGGETLSLPCGVCKIRLNREWEILYANDFYYGLFGYTPGEAAQAGFVTARFSVHPDDFDRVAETIRRNLREGRASFELEHRGVHRFGNILWLLARYTTAPAEPGCLTSVLLDISDRKAVEERLRVSEEENRIALQNTNKLIDIYEIETHVLLQPGKAAAALALPQVVENVPESIVERGMVSDEDVADYLGFYKSMQRGVPEGRTVLRMKSAGGDWRWYDAQYTVIFSEDRPQRAVIAYEDITEQREKELAYEKWSQYFEQQRSNSIGYYEYNLTRDLFDGDRADLPQSLPAGIRSFTGAVRYFVDKFVYEEDIEKYCDFYNREKLLVKYYAGQSFDRIEYRRKRMGGGFFWASGTVQLMPDPYTANVKAFILVQDIDADKRRLMQMQARMEQDALTGLFNRAAVIDKIGAILQRETPAAVHTFAMLDIDYFKNLNDAFGHQFGDEVLRDVAHTLEESLQDGDVCGRLGGDEFVLFFQAVPSVKSVERRLRLLCEKLAKSYHTGAAISVSIGLSLFPRDGRSFEELYHKADIALYEAKGLGRNRYVIYRGKRGGTHMKRTRDGK